MCMGSCFEMVMGIELCRQYPTNLTDAQYPLIEEAQRFGGGRWAFVTGLGIYAIV